MKIFRTGNKQKQENKVKTINGNPYRYKRKNKMIVRDINTKNNETVDD